MDKLFKDMNEEPDTSVQRESSQLDSISELKAKLALVIDKVKSLKEENTSLSARVRELESYLTEKDEELRMASYDKVTIRDQINDLLNELESIETS